MPLSVPSVPSGDFPILPESMPFMPVLLEHTEGLWDQFKTHCKQSVAPMASWAKIALRDIKDAFAELEASPKSLRRWGITVLRFLKGCLTVPTLLGIAVIHTITHLTGVAQLALKVDCFVSDYIRALVDNKMIDYKSKAWFLLNGLRAVTTFIPAFILNFDHVGKVALHISGAHHWDFRSNNAPGRKKELDGEFLNWVATAPLSHADPIKIKFGVKEGKDQNLDGYLLQPKTIPSKGIVIFQHGQEGCYQKNSWIAQNYLEKGYTVLLYNRRGCLGSDGTPTEKNSVDDCERAVLFAREQLKKEGKEESECNESIFIHGHSLGGLIAAKAAERPSLDGVRLVLDRTGVNLQSAGYGITRSITSFATDLLQVTNGAEYENTKIIEKLKGENRLIVIKTGSTLVHQLFIDDNIFKFGEVGMHGEFLERLQKLDAALQDKMVQQGNAERELERKLEEWKGAHLGNRESYSHFDVLVKQFAGKARDLGNFARSISFNNVNGTLNNLRSKLTGRKDQDEMEFIRDLINKDQKFLDELCRQHLESIISNITVYNILSQSPVIRELKDYQALEDVHSKMMQLTEEINNLNAKIALPMQRGSESKLFVSRPGDREANPHTGYLQPDIFEAIDKVWNG